MKLYCVINSVNYEGDELVAVFSSQELAEAKIAQLLLTRAYSRSYSHLEIKTLVLDAVEVVK